MKKLVSVVLSVCLAAGLFLCIGKASAYAEEMPYWQPTRDRIIEMGVYHDTGWVVLDQGTAVPLEIMQVLVANPNVSFEFKTAYNDVAYDIKIPAGTIKSIDEDVLWFGPEYLLSILGSDAVTKTDIKADKKTETAKTQAATGEYVVQKGDFLGSIATKLGTTVAKLLEKNPNIKNANLIYTGNIIKY